MALVGRARIRRGPHGLWIAEGYRFRYPMAGAFTVGNVVTTASTIGRLERVMPDILAHEGRHASQYAVLGPAFFPLYSAAAGWSWAVAGHSAAHDHFETGAGLVSGGYLLAGQQVPLRGLFRDAAGAGRRLRALLGRRGGRSRAGTATRSRER